MICPNCGVNLQNMVPVEEHDALLLKAAAEAPGLQFQLDGANDEIKSLQAENDSLKLQIQKGH